MLKSYLRGPKYSAMLFFQVQAFATRNYYHFGVRAVLLFLDLSFHNFENTTIEAVTGRGSKFQSLRLNKAKLSTS